MQTTETEYADPVDMTTGYFKESVTTLELAGASVIGAALSYDSGLSSIQGKAGYGWRTEYDQYLEEHNGLIQYYAAPGEGTFFIHDNAMKRINYGTIKSGSVYLDSGNAYSQGNYHAIGDMFSDYTLTKNRDNTYTLSYPAGKTYFDEQGRLTGFEDEEGKRILITQGENLVTVTEPISGKKLYLHYAENGLLQSVTDDYGRESTLHYDDRGYLVSVMSPYGNRMFTYDSDGRISGAANALGVYARNVYDEQGRVLTQTDALGGKTTFSYQSSGGNKTVTITDSRGVEKKVFINSAGLISKKILEDGSVVKYTYDAKGHLTGQTDQAGNRTKYTYDKAGNMTELVVADGEKVISTYDGKGNITSISDGRSMTATYAYDDHNRMTRYTTASGRVTTYAYDNNGQLIKESVSGIGSMEYTYEKGLPVTVKDYEGNVSKLYYDALGRRIKTENALGEITETTYDEAGNVLSVTDALGNRIRYTYDGNGNVTSFTDALGNRTAYAYDALGRQTRITYADGTETSFCYDSMGQLLKCLYADGSEQAYVYDVRGNLIKETYPDGTSSTYTYDSLGRVLTVTDAQGNTTGYQYDACGRPTMVEKADGTTITHTYGSNGKVNSTTDEAGYVVYYTYAYDGNGNCIRKTNAAGESVYMEYDALCRMTGAYRGLSDGTEYRVSYAYDANGNLLSFTDEAGRTTAYTYDGGGNLTCVTGPDGRVKAAYETDSMGRTTVQVDALSRKSCYTYDELGRVTGIRQVFSEEELTTEYTYGICGELLSVTDAEGNRTGASYDSLGRVTTVTDAGGGSTSYRYDALGRVTRAENALGYADEWTYDARGQAAGVVNANGERTSYTYDGAGRLTRLTDALGRVRYTYDANGNLLTVTDGQGTIKRTYDCLNRVISYTDAAGHTLGYTYGETGNLEELTYPDGSKSVYTYSPTGELLTVTDRDGSVTSYTYDVNGNLLTTTRPNGTREENTYDEGDRLVRRVEKKTGNGQETVLSEYAYTYDERGNILSITGLETEGVKARVKKVSMTYDGDNRLMTYNGKVVGYDQAGNMTYGPVDGVMTRMTYDCRNRLIQAGDVTYTYDVENNRIGMSTGTVSETYVVDTVSSSLSRVLVTYRTVDGKDSVTTALYGNGLISETTTEDSGTETTYYHHYNHLGSTMYLTDETGDVAATYSYGAYGELLSGNTSLTRYLYNGSYGVCTDANGLLYMRHRYYNPQTMRFISRDIVSGSMTNSQSLNRYCYVQGNPISYVDPFGLSPNENTSWVRGLHAVLGFCGMIPGVGCFFQLADGILYLTIDQNYAMGFACLLGAGASMVFGGISFYSVGKKACGLSKAAKLWQNGALMAQGCSNFLSNGYQFFTGCYDLYSQYASGKPFEVKDLLNIAFLGLNGLGALGGIAGIGFGVHGLNKALKVPATTVVNRRRFESGSNTNTPLSLQQALEELDASGLRPGQTELHMSQLNSVLDGIQNNYNPTKAYSSVYSDGTNRYLVEGHHTTVAFKMLGKDNAINMNTATSDLPSATNVYWTKKWYQFWRKTIKIVED